MELYYPELQQNAATIDGYISFEGLGFKRVRCSSVNGMAVFEGDIILGTVEHMANVSKICSDCGVHSFNLISHKDLHIGVQGVINTSGNWPNRRVYYEISDTISNIDLLQSAIDYWKDTGIYELFPHYDEPNYITFTNNGPGSGLYSTSVGMSGGEQIINLQAGFTFGNAVHEIGHAIGMFHQQQSINYPNFLNILWSNIKPQKIHNFDSKISARQIGIYDYGSIMHYSEHTGFEKSPELNSLQPLMPLAEIGQRLALSLSDLNSAQALFNNPIHSIKVRVQTGTYGTDSKIYLGIGGREFVLNNPSPKDDFKPKSEDTFTFKGLEALIRASLVRLPLDPALGLREILRWPCYIRKTGTGSWSMDYATVTVTDTEFMTATFRSTTQPAVLSEKGGMRVYLKRNSNGLPVFGSNTALINSITVACSTGTHGTDDPVYLGIAGREFCMNNSNDNFEKNSLPNKNTFNFKSWGSKVDNPSLNNPVKPNLTLEDLYTSPVYIRKSGSGRWSLKQCTIAVSVSSNRSGVNDMIANYVLIQPNIELGELSTSLCNFRLSNRSLDSVFSTSIQKLTVVFETGNHGTDNKVYLGAGGREFRLDSSQNDFVKNTISTFILGDSSNVLNPLINDPRTILKADIYNNDLYIRMEGSGSLDIANITIYVQFYGSDAQAVFLSAQPNFQLLEDSTLMLGIEPSFTPI